jgi:ABC-2 type transport system permease protein
MVVLHVAARELRATFHTAVGWLVLAGFLLVTGFFWASMVSFYVIQSTDVLANPYAGAQMNLTDYLLGPFFGNTAVVLLMICPALAMRLFAEETRQRTMELLLTSPVSTAEVVVGKLLGAVAFVAIMLLCTAHFPLTLWMFGEPDWGVVGGGYLVLLLVSASVISIGMLFSAMTSNQIVALVLAFATSLALWILPWAGGQGTDSLMATLAEHLALGSHIDEMLKGAIRVSDLAYFALFIGFFTFATHQRVEGYRWS